MIESIDIMCRIWGVQKRRIITGRSGSGHEDGWPQETVLAKIREMRENAGASHGEREQHFAETYTDADALTVHRSARGMPEALASVLFVHYVLPSSYSLTVRRKSSMINQSTREYWRNIDRAHHWLAARIAGESNDGSN
jgi:hypothetical protein